jgi:hypothetical protein
MARMSKWYAGRFRWHTAFTVVPAELFLLPDQRLHTVKNMCVYIHISDCIETIYELPLLPNNSAVKHSYTNLSGVKCLLDIYHWGDGVGGDWENM